MHTPTSNRFQDIRDAVRDLCKAFPDEYHRKIDQQRGYPEAFVDALTQAGWLAALIPQEYGGSGLGLLHRECDVAHGHAADRPFQKEQRRASRHAPGGWRDAQHAARRHGDVCE